MLCWLHLQNSSWIPRLRISSSTTAPARAARHGYCNNFLYVLPFSSLVLHPFILSMVTRLVSLKCKSDYVLPLVTLQELALSLRKSNFLQSSADEASAACPPPLPPFVLSESSPSDASFGSSHTDLLSSALSTGMLALKASALSLPPSGLFCPTSQISCTSLRSYAQMSCLQQGLP